MLQKKPILLVFSGLPGSGKSTVAKETAQQLGNTILSATDAFRCMITEPKYTSRESRLVYDSAMSFAEKALELGYNAILDGTFLKQEYRKEALERLNDLYSEAFVVFVKCDKDTAWKRNVERKYAVPTESFHRMLKVLEAPEDGVIIDSTVLSPVDAARLVISKLATKCKATLQEAPIGTQKGESE
nr:ATP-binding protein [Ferrimicrobium acidiphilum]